MKDALFFGIHGECWRRVWSTQWTRWILTTCVVHTVDTVNADDVCGPHSGHGEYWLHVWSTQWTRWILMTCVVHTVDTVNADDVCGPHSGHGECWRCK